MDRGRRFKSACQSPACGDRQAARMVTSFHGTHKRWRRAAPGLVLFCLIALFGFPARAQAEFEDKLAPQDTVEVRIWRWTALRGGVAEALALSKTFTIGAAGTLDLPIIGKVTAAGLRAGDLEKLISDHLQARSGLHERPITKVTPVRRDRHPPLDENGSLNASPVPEAGPAPVARDGTSAADSERLHVEGQPPVAQFGSDGSRATAAGPAAMEQQEALEPELSGANALLRDLAAARMEAEAARKELRVGREAARHEALRYHQLLTAERQSTATLTRELRSVRADLEAVKAQLDEAAKAALHVREAAETRADKNHELAVRERAKGAALEQHLLAARREIDALKNSAQSIGEREEGLRRELATARKQLDAMREAASVASGKAREAAGKTAEQQRAREEQQQQAEELARDLKLAQREVESLKTKAALAIRDSAAMHRERHAAETALAEERHKVGLYERDLALARQSIDALETRATLTAAALATGQAVEAAARRAGEALALERKRAESAAGALDFARQERDEAKDELNRLSAAQRKALEQERNKVSALGRDLTEARKEIDSLKEREARQTIEHKPKARANDRTTPRATPPVRPGARQVKVRKPRQTVQLTRMVLPDALLPTKPPLMALRHER